MSNNLKQKQEQFSLLYFETGNASEAYRVVYNAENMKQATIHKRASELLNSDSVKARIEQLRADAVKRSNITVDSLLDELEQARQKALNADTPQANAAVNATMSKAKLLGLDKQIIEQTNYHIETKKLSEIFES